MDFEMVKMSVQNWWHSTMDWFMNTTAVMDMPTVAIFVGVFLVSVIVVYLISVFGMRERTYEEAIEEQRRRNQEEIQQAKSEKAKKEKKFKKWGKKSKEKIEEKPQPSDGEVKVHEQDVKAEVEIQTTASPIVDEKSSAAKKKQKKSLIADKEERVPHQSSSEDADEVVPQANSVASVQTKQSIPVAEIAPEPKSISVKEDAKKQTSAVQEPVKDGSPESKEAGKSPLRKSPIKKNKKNKQDNMDSGSDANEWNEIKIISIIKSANLSEEELEHILEALNAKHQAKVESKVKYHVISTMKKQLMEKEEALQAEKLQIHKANETINDLMRDVKEEAARASETESRLRDMLDREQKEIKLLRGMIQRNAEQHASEVAAHQSKMQQMKTKLKEEHTVGLKHLQDEIAQLQTLNRVETDKQQRSNMEATRLQHELEQMRSSVENYEAHKTAMQQGQEDLRHQVQQLEKHIEQLVSSHQEEEYSYKQKINEMSNKLQQTENSRTSLVQELQNAQSVCSSLESDNTSLRQRLDDAKHQLSSSEQDIIQFQSSLEDSNRQQRDLASCLEKLRGEMMDLTNTNNEQMQMIQSLKQENESLVSKLSETMEKLAASNAEKQNGEIDEKLANYIEKDQHENIMQEKEKALHHVLQELDQYRSESEMLSKDVENLKETNKNLVNKNGELIEKLNTSEEKLDEVIKSADQSVEEAQRKADNRTKEMQNILNEQIKEVEKTMQETYAKELENVREELERTQKEAEEEALRLQSEADIRLEEFQESLYKRLNEVNCEAEESIKESTLEKEKLTKEMDNLQQAVKQTLKIIFPMVDINDGLGYQEWLSEYESKATQCIQEMKSAIPEPAEQKLNDIVEHENNLEERLKLQCQVKHYESVLAETETILKNLQNNVEREEVKWKAELSSKEERLKEVLTENEVLHIRIKTLETSLEELQGLKEALCKVEELKEKLHDEESEKRILEDKLGVIDSLTNSPTISTSSNHTQVSEGASGKK